MIVSYFEQKCLVKLCFEKYYSNLRANDYVTLIYLLFLVKSVISLTVLAIRFFFSVIVLDKSHMFIG